MNMKLRNDIIIVSVYLLTGFLWIYFSDKLPGYLSEYSIGINFTKYQTYKGLLYVTITGILLLLMLRSNNKILGRSLEKLKKNQQVLRQSEEKYRVLYHESPGLKVIYDIDTLNILDVNSAATQDYGYSIEEFRKMSVLDLCPQQEFKDKLHAVNKDDKIVRIGVFNHTNKDGTIRVVDIMGHKVVFNGKTCILLLANDITERLDALRQLEENQKKLSAAQKIARIGYWQLNMSNNKLFWSDEVYTIWGANKITFHPDYDSYVNTIHPDDIPEFKIKAAALMEKGEIFDFQHRIVRPDGTTRWVHEKGQGIKDQSGNLSLLEGTVQDITEQKLSELALEEINQRYQYVTKATFDAVWDWDIVNDVIIWGEGFSEIFGYKLNELKKDISSWTDHIHPEDQAYVIQSINSFINGTETIWQSEYKYMKADGTYAIVQDRGYAVRDNKGRVTRIVGAMQDITRQKEEEQRLKLLESVITNANDAVMITEAEPIDMPGPKIIYVNDAFTRMTGYTSEEVVGKTPRVLQGPKTDKLKLEHVRQYLKKWQPCTATVINYKKNGEEFWNSFSISPVADKTGWYTHWISIERDVTESMRESVQKEFLASLALSFNLHTSLDETLLDILKKLVDFGGFCLAEAWLVDGIAENINLVAQYPTSDLTRLFYRESNHIHSMALNEGIAGITWSTKEIQYWDDLQNTANFIRKDAARVSGVKAVYGIPLLYNDELLGVLVLGRNKKEPEDPTFARLADLIKTSFGAELRHKQKEEQLDQFFNFSPDVICVLGNDGYFKRVNPATCNLLEYKAEEMVNKYAIDFLHPDDVERSTRELGLLSQGNSTMNFENRFITKTGKVKWFSWTAAPYTEKGLLFCAGKDVTDKVILENRLKKAHDIARIGVWEIDMEANSIFWSDIARQIHQVPQDFIPDTGNTMGFFEGDSMKGITDAITNAIENGIAFDDEFQLRTYTGTLIWVRLIGEAEFIAGKCVRVYGSIQDITERHNYTEAIERQNEKLREIAWIQSHEVRAPLASIMGLAMLIKDGTVKKESESADKVLDDIVKSAADLDAVIRKISEKANTPG